MESTELAVQGPVPNNPGPDLTLPLPNVYHLNDCDAWGYSDAHLVAAALSVWTALVYGHFEIGIGRVLKKNSQTGAMEPDYMFYTFKCKHDPTNCRMCTRKQSATRYGTQNLKTAVRACDKRRGVPDSLVPLGPEFTFSQLLFRVMLVIWCIVNHRPFHTIANPLFLNIVHLLHPDAIVPTPQTLSSDLTYIYDIASIQICEVFMEMGSGVHLAIDGWSSPLTASFLGIVVFWWDGAQIYRSILEFIHLTESHTGIYLAEKTLECLDRFSLTNQVTSICLDNASNNETFVRQISSSLPNFPGTHFRTRCIAHITNLVAKAFMAVFTRPASKKRKIAKSRALAKQPGPSNLTSATGINSASSLSDPTNSEDLELEQPLDELDAILDIPDEFADEGMELHDAGVVQKAVLTAMNEMRVQFGVEVDDEEFSEARSITGFAHQIHTVSTLYATFKSILAAVKDSVSTKKEVPTKRVATRWNSDYACAETHLELRTPISIMTSNPTYKMSKYMLSVLQWEMLSELVGCLAVFYHLTLVHSQSCVPLIHEVIPDLLVLKFRLELMRDDVKHELKSVTRVAAQAALHVLDKYLKRLEESDIYWFAIVLCPWYKLHWFYDEGYPAARIEYIRRALYERYVKYRTAANTTNSNSGPSPSPSSSAATPSPTDDIRTHWMRARVPPARMTSASSSSTPRDPLAIYLTSAPVDRDEVERVGLLKYWQLEMQKSAPLARMALDILSAPASSVDAERAFSGGRMAINYRQHRTSIATFRAKMAVGSWFGTPLLQDIHEVLEIVDGKGSLEPEPVDL
ncbi:unnamed protein product [Rhizoctonia solani]|uniref:HAT C-terminal dimerisation domain-containing protein n=1 Tax=Rhizoctonia solani TaxID=456999 RepID=A0A8H2XGF2_9AGAM|nr:unnamed protein product [Rhizoctonia solani]